MAPLPFLVSQVYTRHNPLDVLSGIPVLGSCVYTRMHFSYIILLRPVRQMVPKRGAGLAPFAQAVSSPTSLSVELDASGTANGSHRDQAGDRFKAPQISSLSRHDGSESCCVYCPFPLLQLVSPWSPVAG